MTTTTAKFPGTSASVVRGGASAWANPSNAGADDTTDTTVAVPADYLVCTNFGFSVPANATILGVTVRVEASETGSGTSTYIPQLCSDATPTLIGAAKSAVGVSGTTKAISTNGGATDVWSASLTPAIVNGSGFGAVLWSTDTVNTLLVDYVTVEVEYTASLLSALGAG